MDGPPAHCAHVQKLPQQVTNHDKVCYLQQRKRMTAQRVDSAHVHALPVQNTSWSGPPAHCAHVHKPPQQVVKPRELLALQKVQHPYHGRTSVNRLPLTKQDILSHYSGCFEGIGHFPGDLYKFHLKPEHKPARHAPRKVPIHIEDAFKEKIKSLVELGILEEVKEHTDQVNPCYCGKGLKKPPLPKPHNQEETVWILGT